MKIKWRVFRVDHDINGSGFAPALQMKGSVMAESADEACVAKAPNQPFDGREQFVAIRADDFYEITVRGEKTYNAFSTPEDERLSE